MADSKQTARRRTILAGLGAAAVGSALGTTSVSAQQQESDYVVEQGGECLPITPLAGDDPVEEFYDWDLAQTAFSSHGTKDLQEPDTSLLFLYRGPEGDLSLVIVHDEHTEVGRTPTSDGGSATSIIAGLPEDGDWIVRDDFYEASSRFDRWDVDDDPQQIDWTWDAGRTDGGAYGPLGSSFEFTIDPAFNGAATLYDEYYEGEISEWVVLSGDVDDPERTSIDLETSVTIRTGSCDGDAASVAVDGDLDVEVVPGAVNPDSQGVVPVEVRLPDGLSTDDLDRESVHASSSGATPRRIASIPGDDRRMLLFFSTQDLDLSGEGSTTLGVEAETTDGQSLSGESSVSLVPTAGGDDDDGGPFGDDDDDGVGQGPPGNTGTDDDGPPGQGPDGDGPPGQDQDDDGLFGGDDDDDDGGGLFDGLFGNDDDDGDDDEDDD